MDLAERPDGLARLMAKVHAFYLEEMEIWARTDVDALVFADDWGGQNGLLISPALWRELFKPLYRDYVEIAHRHGKYAFMHSDGHIAAILPDLVEIGLDALNAQLFTMDIEAIGREFAGKLTFWGEVDRQHLLPYGTPGGRRGGGAAGPAGPLARGRMHRPVRVRHRRAAGERGRRVRSLGPDGLTEYSYNSRS